MSNNTKKRNAPSHNVVVDNGGRFIGSDGKEHVSTDIVGIAWSDEAGRITSVRLPLLGITLFFRVRKAKTADAGADEGAEAGSYGDEHEGGI